MSKLSYCAVLFKKACEVTVTYSSGVTVTEVSDDPHKTRMA